MKREIRTIAFGTADYYKAVKLRDKILRKPLGMVFTKEFLEQDATEYIIGIFEENEILAVLHLKPLDKNILKMRQVAVDDYLQGQGIGSELVLYSEEFARKKGCKKFVLHARDTAVKFYKNLNYTVEGDQFEEVGILHYIMHKKL